MGRARQTKLGIVVGIATLGLGFPGQGVLPWDEGAWTMAKAEQPRTQATPPAVSKPPTPAILPNPVLLGPGANPEEVIILQRQLRQLGLYQGNLDGDYGATTQEAVAAFQRANELAATGLLDRQTWDRMRTPQLLSPAAEPEAAAPPPDLLAATRTPTAPAADPAEVTPSVEDAPTSPPAEESAIARPALPWWALALALGLLGLVSAGLLGWRRRSRPRASEPTVAEGGIPAPPAENGVALAPPTASPPAPLAPSPAPLHTSAAAPAEAAGASPALSPTPLSETTRLSTVNILDTLVEELASADATVRHKAIWELGQRGNSAAIQPLVNGLLDADSQEKSLILAALSEINSRSLKPMHRALALGLQDPSPEVRKNAIRDLSRVYDTVVQLSHMLAHATQDPDPEVQETAQWALGQLHRIRPASYPEALPPETTYPGDRLPPSPTSP